MIRASSRSSEAFHFATARASAPTDPMHFEYCQAPCAPAVSAAGALGTS
jgi:hypothetical protein